MKLQVAEVESTFSIIMPKEKKPLMLQPSGAMDAYAFAYLPLLLEVISQSPNASSVLMHVLSQKYRVVQLHTDYMQETYSGT